MDQNLKKSRFTNKYPGLGGWLSACIGISLPIMSRFHQPKENLSPKILLRPHAACIRKRASARTNTH